MIYYKINPAQSPERDEKLRLQKIEKEERKKRDREEYLKRLKDNPVDGGYGGEGTY